MTLKEIKELTSKGYSEAFLSNKYVFRYISVYITYLCLKLNISANFVTFISLIFAVLGAYLQSYADFQVLYISCGMLFFYYILDMVDGEVARYNAIILNKNNGKAGAYFDAYVHYILTPVLFLSLGLFSYNSYGSMIYIWLGLWVGMWLSSYAQSAAYRVIFDSILTGDKNQLDSVKKLWSHDKINRNKASKKETVRFIIREFFSSQGQIFSITITVILDSAFSPELSFRTAYLIFMGIIALINVPRVAVNFYSQLKNIN